MLTLQTEIRPALPNVYGTIDYKDFRDTLIKIDEILVKSGLEHDIISEILAKQMGENKKEAARLNRTKSYNSHYNKLKHALRCNIARHLSGESYRAFSIRLADSNLYQWFTFINGFAVRQAISKSSLERYEKMFPEDFIAEKTCQLLFNLSASDKATKAGLVEAIEIKDVFVDSTCVEANIHYPVDWLLLRDASRSLLLAINTIRKQGLKHRMIEPEKLLTLMNKLCIKMTHARRKKDSKKQRKIILRLMKKLSQRISEHATRYRQLLADKWTKTQWSEAQMQQVLDRLDAILEQLPAAIKQAHDRIIGERVIKQADKILSFFDKDSQVIVRGKAGHEVEFGQRLILTEQKDGLIIDWELFGDSAPSDGQLLKPVVERIEKHYGSINSICGDRAFSSEKNADYLSEKNIYNALCPKAPKQLQEKLSELQFSDLQTRRSQTEARIGIFKNVFLGRPLRSRITLHKKHAVNWCVLSHNLWVLARKAIADEKRLSEALQKAA